MINRSRLQSQSPPSHLPSSALPLHSISTKERSQAPPSSSEFFHTTTSMYYYLQIWLYTLVLEILCRLLTLTMNARDEQQQSELQVDTIQSVAEEPSFHSFNNLPAELRLEVWALNLPSSRLVQVHYDARIGRFWTTTPAPANLLVCSESRYEMLKKWPLRFGTPAHPPLVRTNLDIDIIQMDWNPLRLRAVSQEELSGILSLEIGGRELQRARPEAILQAILTMPNLKYFSIVSPALCDTYPYSLSQQLSHPHVGPYEEEHWLLTARRLGYEERRNRSFHQHTEVTRCFRAWAREHQDCKLPRLRLLLSEPDGSRSGPFFWKP